MQLYGLGLFLQCKEIVYIVVDYPVCGSQSLRASCLLSHDVKYLFGFQVAAFDDPADLGFFIAIDYQHPVGVLSPVR